MPRSGNRDYVEPSLTVYGSLSDLTQGNGKGNADSPNGNFGQGSPGSGGGPGNGGNPGNGRGRGNGRG